MTIVRNLNELSYEGIAAFAEALREDRYTIISMLPADDNIPQNLSDTLQNIESFKIIFEDSEAYFTYFAMRYTGDQGEEITFPLGVFGTSPSRRIRFPLVINGVWVSILALGKEHFALGLQLSSEDACDFYFQQLLGWKKTFIQKIFIYFRDHPYCSVMTWPARSSQSNTRIIAESLGFQRSSFNNTDIYYSKAESIAELLPYLRNCIFRWRVMDENKPNLRPELNDKVIQFVGALAHCTIDAII